MYQAGVVIVTRISQAWLNPLFGALDIYISGSVPYLVNFLAEYGTKGDACWLVELAVLGLLLLFASNAIMLQHCQFLLKFSQ